MRLVAVDSPEPGNLPPGHFAGSLRVCLLLLLALYLLAVVCVLQLLVDILRRPRLDLSAVPIYVRHRRHPRLRLRNCGRLWWWWRRASLLYRIAGRAVIVKTRAFGLGGVGRPSADSESTPPGPCPRSPSAVCCCRSIQQNSSALRKLRPARTCQDALVGHAGGESRAAYIYEQFAPRVVLYIQ